MTLNQPPHENFLRTPLIPITRRILHLNIRVSQGHRVKQIIKDQHIETRKYSDIFSILFFETCFLNTSFYVFQMLVFVTFLNTRIW